MFTPPKTSGSTRLLPLSPKLIELLRQNKERGHHQWQEQDLVFPSTA